MNKENENMNAGNRPLPKSSFTPKWEGIEPMHPVMVNLEDDDSSEEKTKAHEKSIADHCNET